MYIYISLHLKFRKNISYRETSTAHWHIVTSRWLKPPKQHLVNVTSFRLSNSLYFPSFLFKRINNFCSDFPYLLGRTFCMTEIPKQFSTFFLIILYFSNRFHFCFVAHNALFGDCSHVITYRSPIDHSIEKYRTLVHT